MFLLVVFLSFVKILSSVVFLYLFLFNIIVIFLLDIFKDILLRIKCFLLLIKYFLYIFFSKNLFLII